LGLETIIAVDPEFNGPNAKAAEKKLVARLSPYQEKIQPEYQGLYLPGFEEPEFVMLLSQCSNPDDFDSFLQKGLTLVAEEAQKSLGNKRPNYRLQAHKLLEDIGEYIGKTIRVNEIPRIIEGFSSHRPDDQITELQINSHYVHALVQKNGSSFTYDLTMQSQVRKLTRKMRDDLEKSKAIFDWVTSHIKYGKKKRARDVGYRGALEVFIDREGICGESAALQATMERLAGNMAYLVQIEKGAVGVTASGRSRLIDGPHAAVAHLRPSGEVVLIDTTISDGFGIKYDKFNIISDEHSLAGYK